MALIGSVYNSRTGVTTQHFEPIELKQRVKKNCSKCGKSRTRVIQASQTVNPFNKNKDGSVKTRQQVYESVKEKLAANVKQFMDEDLICNSCYKEE